jgi:hypothetical protein
MAEYRRYGDLATVILNDYEQSATLGEARPLQEPDVDGAKLSDILPEVGALAVQGGMQLIPQLRAFNLAGRGISTLFGGGVGAAGGETLRQQVTGEKLDPSKAAMKGLENMAWDAAGALTFSIAGKVFKLSSDQVKRLLGKEVINKTPDEAALAAQQFFTERGTTLTPFQAVGGRTNALTEGIARASILSGSVVKDLDRKQVDAIRTALDQLSAGADTLTRQEFGQGFSNVIKAGEDALSAWAAPKYAAIDAAANGIKVRVSGLKKSADFNIKSNKELAINPEVTRFLQEQIKGIQSDTLTFAQARKKLSDLKAQQRALDSKDPLQKIINSAITRLENEMEEAAKRAGSDVYSMYRGVNEEFADVAKKIRGDTVMEALAKNPERIGEYFFNKGNVTEVQDAYSALAKIAEKNPDLAEDVDKAVDQFQSSYIKAVFESVTDEGTLQTVLNTVRSQKGKETLDAVLGGGDVFKGVKPKAATMESILNAAEYSLNRPDSVMSLFIAGKEAGGIEKVAVGTVAAGASIIAALPTIFARSVADPKKVNELLKVNRLSLKVGFTDQVASKLVQMAQDLGIDLAEFSPTVEVQPQQSSTQPQQRTVTSPDISDLLR